VFLIFVPVAFGMKILASTSSAKGWKEQLNYCFERIGESVLLTLGILLIIYMMYGATISAMGIYIELALISIKWYLLAWVAVEIEPLLKRIYVKALAGGLKNQHLQ
jgi:hypothetical protein